MGKYFEDKPSKSPNVSKYFPNKPDPEKSSKYFEHLEEEPTDPSKNRFFAHLRENNNEPLPEDQSTQEEPKKSIWSSFGQALNYQMKSGGPAGAPSLSPEQAKKVATEVGTQQAVAGIFAPIKALAGAAKYAPRALKFITGLTESAATGAAVPTVQSLVNGEELPTKEELLKDGAIWAGIDLVLQAAHLGTRFGSTVNQLSKETGLKRSEVVSRIWKGAKNYYGWDKPKIDPETGAAIIMPEQIEQMAKLAEREPQIILGKAEKVSEPVAQPSKEKPVLTEEQIKNRKISEAYIKQVEERNAADVKTLKDQTEKERLVAFKALGLTEPQKVESSLNEVIPDNSDSDVMDVLEDQEISEDQKIRQQAFAEMALMKDKVSEKIGSFWSNVDVEHPFKAAGAPNTGRAVKLYYDTKNAYMEEAKGIINQVSNLELTKEQNWEAFVAAESGATPTDPKIAKAAKIYREYFDKSFDKYKQSGGLREPFPQSLILRLEQRIIDLKTKLSGENIRKQAHGKIGKEISEIRETIKTLQNLKYIPKSVSLISQALAEAFGDVDPVRVKQFAIAAHKKRTTGALADWLKSDPRIMQVLNPFDFIGDYAQKKGSDLALLKIIQASKDEGLAVNGPQQGFKMDPIKFPALSGYNVHPALFEYLTNLANPIPFNTYDKISRWAKGAIVLDPFYFTGILIPYFRTLIKSPKDLAKLPKYWRKALTDFFGSTPDYVEFIENGGASTPFPENRDFQDFVKKAGLDNSSLMKILENNFLTKHGLKNLGNNIVNFTWTVERLARMAYYNMLRDKGFSPSDAAKMAAENFIDYNKLPAKTRRWVGRLFFAPVYQILSLINDVTLLGSPFKLAKDFVNDRENFKNNRINKERLGLLIGTAVILFGLDQLYKNFGYEQEEFGTRYFTEFEDEDGKQKELVITPSHPLNVGLRWLNTFLRGFGPGESSPIQKITGRLMGQLGPVPSLIKDLSTNKGSDNKPIWDPVGDSLYDVMRKVFLHTLNKTTPFIVSKFHTPEEKTAARQKVKDTFGALDYFLDSVQFFYERKTAPERDKAKIKYLRSQVSKLRKQGNLTEEAEERYRKAIESISDK